MSRKPKRESLASQYEKGEAKEDLRGFADACARLFFKNKSYFCGGPIPDRELVSEFAQKTILNTEFDDENYEFIHDRCLPLLPVNPAYQDMTVPWTVHSLIGLINELKALEIPKERQTGLILLYFKFCFGVKIPEPPLH